AFDQIVAGTGVQISIAQQTLDLLPYGKNTRLNANVRQVPLREGLAGMCASLGLTFEIKGRGLELVPTPPLSRLCRRASFDELETLANLAQTPIDVLLADGEALAGRLQFKLDHSDDLWSSLQNELAKQGSAPADQALEQACQALGWAWHAHGKQIVILRRIDQQLRQNVSLRQTGRRLMDVLQALGQAGDVKVRCEPGAIAALPPRTRTNFSFYYENRCLGDAFSLVAATTGLGYRVDPDAVVFFNPAGQPEAPQQSTALPQPLTHSRRPGDPYVGKIILPPGQDGLVIELLVHESDLSAETNTIRKKWLDRADQEIKRALRRLEQQSDR
ncbi:MAG: hypothetical protein ACE5GE_16330, partial [Phycisphaerae bacterium]